MAKGFTLNHYKILQYLVNEGDKVSSVRDISDRIMQGKDERTIQLLVQLWDLGLVVPCRNDYKATEAGITLFPNLIKPVKFKYAKT